VLGGILEKECGTLLTSFFRNGPNPRS
jgi:hypothetical protein